MPVVNGVSGGVVLLGFMCVFLRKLCPIEKFCMSVLVLNGSIQQPSEAVRAFPCKLRSQLKSQKQGHASNL